MQLVIIQCRYFRVCGTSVGALVLIFTEKKKKKESAKNVALRQIWQAKDSLAFEMWLEKNLVGGLGSGKKEEEKKTSRNEEICLLLNWLNYVNKQIVT